MSLHILAVDTEVASLKMIRLLGVGEGYTVSTFEGFQDARTEGERRHFDIVFVGTGKTQADGLELVGRLRAAELNRESTIVMLSATDDVTSLRKAFSEGADLVLVKPMVTGRIRSLLAAMRSPGWKAKRRAARMPLFTNVKCVWDDREFAMRSLNISESGMLLQPDLDAEVGQEVGLEFAVAELGASLSLLARLVRKEEKKSIAVEFIGLAPEDQNVIQLYVMGRLKDAKHKHESADGRMRRLLDPFA